MLYGSARQVKTSLNILKKENKLIKEKYKDQEQTNAELQE